MRNLKIDLPGVNGRVGSGPSRASIARPLASKQFDLPAVANLPRA